MQRRDFLAAAAATPLILSAARSAGAEEEQRTFATPMDAMRSPREELAYVVCTYAGTQTKKPDYLATIDLDPKSKTYSQVVHRLAMPNVGDELHHYGWNACASCHGERARRYLIVPGLVSGRIHIVDTADPKQPKLHKVIEPDEVVKKTKLTAPHTVHCLADGQIMISMLGNEKLDGPGGFLLLDQDFKIAGHWEINTEGMNYNYDFWYQPRHNVMVSSEWAAPKTTRPGFKLDDVKEGKYGRHIHFWDWEQRRIVQSIDLGAKGVIPLEVRWHHDPDSTHGFVGAALSSVVWHWQREQDKWDARPVIEVEGQEVKGWDFPVPGLITDLVLSLDDRWLYFSNWLHGDIRQYDVSDPAKPRLAAQLWVGGLLGKAEAADTNPKRERADGNPKRERGTPRNQTGGPQMLQLSLDGKRLYVTNSLFSSWDDQFYPQIAKAGSYLLQVDCNTEKGGLALNDQCHVDFGKEPSGPVRAHEIRFPQGDCTSDIWQ